MGIGGWRQLARTTREKCAAWMHTSARRRYELATAHPTCHFDPLESRTLLSVTALSFVDAQGNAVTSMYAGQNIYLRADAANMAGKTIQVSVWEDDGTTGDDKIVTKSIKIGKDGIGTTVWTTSQSTWQYKDESNPNNSFYLYYDAPASEQDVYSGAAGVGTLKISAGGFIKRVDKSAAIQSDVTTFVIVHGLNGNAGLSWISQMTSAIKSAAARDKETYQVLTLDWSYCANSTINGTTLKYAKAVGQFAADTLAGYGLTGANINLIGHSWGAYVADETAERLGGVNTIVALDPGQIIPISYGESEVNFAAHSNWSWAFHASDIYGSKTTPGTADRAFLIQATDSILGGSHNSVPVLFSRMISSTTGGVSELFSLSKLLSAAQVKSSGDLWQLNKYGQRSFYEATIATVGNSGSKPASITFKDRVTGATRTIAEVQPTISISVRDSRASERLTGSDDAVIRISRSGGTSTEALTVQLSVSGTATEGEDYAAIAKSIVIPAGKSYVDITIKVLDDSIAEVTEDIIVTLEKDAWYKLGSAKSTKISITDNESVVKLSVKDSSAKESVNGKQTAAFTVTRSGIDLSQELRVDYYVDGTATNGNDYVALIGCVTFAPGVKSITILIEPLSDEEAEPTETVLLRLITSTTYLSTDTVQKVVIYNA